MNKTVLVTGGTGFVAGWCIVELLRRGYRVRTTLRDLAKAPAVRMAVATQVGAGDRLAFCAADLTADGGWQAAMAGCDYVLHVARRWGSARPPAWRTWSRRRVTAPSAYCAPPWRRASSAW